jgi:hypothetical protein
MLQNDDKIYFDQNMNTRPKKMTGVQSLDLRSKIFYPQNSLETPQSC